MRVPQSPVPLKCIVAVIATNTESNLLIDLLRARSRQDPSLRLGSQMSLLELVQDVVMHQRAEEMKRQK